MIAGNESNAAIDKATVTPYKRWTTLEKYINATNISAYKGKFPQDSFTGSGDKYKKTFSDTGNSRQYELKVEVYEGQKEV